MLLRDMSISEGSTVLKHVIGTSIALLCMSNFFWLEFSEYLTTKQNKNTEPN